MLITFPYNLVHDKNLSDEERGETARFVANAFNCAERVSGILLKRECLPSAN